MSIKVGGIHYIDLDSPGGNALALGGLAYNWQAQLGDPKPYVSIFGGAQSYEQVLNRFDELFKHRVGYKFLHDPREPDQDEEGDDDD